MRLVPNCDAVMGAIDTQFIASPRYRCMGLTGTGRPSCSAFLMPTIGCMRMTSMLPPMAPAHSGGGIMIAWPDL